MLSSKVVASSKTDLESVLTEALELTTPCSSRTSKFFLGEIVHINEKGEPFIDYPGNHLGPIRARSIVNQLPVQEEERVKLSPLSFAEGDFQELNKKISIPVLLVFENEDHSLPIIIGTVHSTLRKSAPMQKEMTQCKRPKDIVLDGRALLLDAEESITVRCGKSSVTLKKDGKIILKGTDIISRASRTNKIKGASVAVN